MQYLGHVEVEESRGMHICEDAVKRLKMVGFTRKLLRLLGMRLLNTRHPTSILSVLFLIFSSNNFLLFDTNILLTFSDIYFVCQYAFLFFSIIVCSCLVFSTHRGLSEANCYHLSVRVSTQHDSQTTSRVVRVCAELLFLSLYTVSAGTDSLLPDAVDSVRVAQKEHFPVWGAGRVKGGKQVEQLLLHAVCQGPTQFLDCCG